MAHDHLVGMGADCYGSDGEKKTPQGDLAKTVGEMQTSLQAAQKEIARLNAQPMPHIVTLTLAKKGQPAEKEANPLEKLKSSDCVWNPDGTINFEATEAKLKLGAAA